jgi:hypothetical protein
LHRDELAAHRIAIPNPVAMDLLFDKERTRELCVQLGMPVAASAPLAPSDRAATLVERFALPLVLKPRKSFWIDRLDSTDKVWIVESEVELRRSGFLAALFNRSRAGRERSRRASAGSAAG